MTYLKVAPAFFLGFFAVSFILCGTLVDGEDMKDMEAEDSMMMGDGSVFGCDNCGAECKLKCGTRRFRSCCLHFLRKRSPFLTNPVAIRKQQQQQQQQPQPQPQQQHQHQLHNPWNLELTFRNFLTHLNSFGTTGSPIDLDFYNDSNSNE